jgi:peptidoglycan/LPS O-acetylase OafA/YrhL
VFVSGGITLALAVLSWHLIERRALRLKGYYVQRTQRMLFSLSSANVRNP